MDNVILYFSGTGNSLKVAKDISKELGNCEISSMGKPFEFSKQYESIGFVFPVYYYGLPKRVIDFVKNANFQNGKNAYFYSIATNGSTPGNANFQLYELLEKNHGIRLNYGAKLKMFSNYVVLYNMKKNVGIYAAKSNERLLPIIKDIKEKKNNRINKLTKIYSFINKWFVKNVSNMDKNHNVNGNCSGCLICEKVCPVRNIEIINNRPAFKHHCENCTACIQYCPQRAINFKNLTQKRRRYTNPEIDYTELWKYNR